jgi:UDP-glucose 4-epimerase
MLILVTGGSGFIGSHLCRLLVEKGHEVRVLDLVEPKAPGVDYVQGDVRSFDDAAKSMKGVDAVVHLAALISVDESVRKPADYHATNVTGSLNVMRACIVGGVRRFVYTSSAAVYGNPSSLPLREDSPTVPISPYGATKLAPELYAGAFHASYGLFPIVLRLFNVYGPGQALNDYSGVITRFIENARAGRSPVIFGDGQQSRSFINVRDVSAAIYLAVTSRIAFGTFNIASKGPITINDLARMTLSAAGRNDLLPVHQDPRPGDITHSYANTSKAHLVLGFEPKVGLDEGLDELLKR